MLEIGKHHTLEVLRKTSVGVYLDDGENGILMPLRYVPENTEAGDKLNVFVYLDNLDRPVATTLKPIAEVGEFAFLVVKEVNQHGAFLDWGIAKDIFVPFAEQRDDMHPGRKYIVYIFIDEKSGRITATEKWQSHLEKENIVLAENEKVNLIISEDTDMGFKAIINNKFEGLLYNDEIFQPLEVGMKLPGYVRKVRDDKKIDLRLKPPGMLVVEDTREQILSYLKSHEGVMKLGDKSSPEEIYDLLNMSKKVFKKTIGTLYKERLITMEEKLVKLIQPVIGNQ